MAAVPWVTPLATPWVAPVTWVASLERPWVAGETLVAGVGRAVLHGVKVLGWIGNMRMGPPPSTLNIYLTYFVGFVKEKVCGIAGDAVRGSRAVRVDLSIDG